MAERLELGPDIDHPGFDELRPCPTGRFVRYSDYKQLERDRDVEAEKWQEAERLCGVACGERDEAEAERDQAVERRREIESKLESGYSFDEWRAKEIALRDGLKRAEAERDREHARTERAEAQRNELLSGVRELQEDRYLAVMGGPLDLPEGAFRSLPGAGPMNETPFGPETEQAIRKQERERLAARSDDLPSIIEDWVGKFPEPARETIRVTLLAVLNVQAEDVAKLVRAEVAATVQAFTDAKPMPGRADDHYVLEVPGDALRQAKALSPDLISILKQERQRVIEALLVAMEKARQGSIGPGNSIHFGELAEGREVLQEVVQVVALDDFNAALDSIFEEEDSDE